MAAEKQGSDELVIPLVEETAQIEKRRVTTGRVRLSTAVDTTEQTLRETLQGETVDIDRVAVDRMIEAGEGLPQVRTEGDVTIIPVVEETLVVEKRLVLKEELHVRRRITQEAVEVPVTLRKTRVEIEHIDADTATSTPATRSSTER